MWNSSKGLLFLVLLGFSLLAAGVWLRLPTQSPVQAAACKLVTEQTNAQIYDAWKNHFSNATVERPQWVVEKQYAQQTYLKVGLGACSYYWCCLRAYRHCWVSAQPSEQSPSILLRGRDADRCCLGSFCLAAATRSLFRVAVPSRNLALLSYGT